MSQRPKIILLPGLLCDASTWAAQVRALEPYANVTVADFSQLNSIEAMAQSALALVDGPIVDPRTRGAVIEALEAADRERARRLLEGRLDLYYPPDLRPPARD